jgi:flagellar biosynthesis/type III secretory pathway M-ring protein FliF/YscJ
MLGTIWINVGTGLLAFAITFVTAWASNIWLVSLERAGFAFVLFFLAAFPIRWVIARVTQTPAEAKDEVEETKTPSADGKEDTEKKEVDEPFTPLTISNMERIHPIQDPATVAEVVRRFTDE